MNHQIKYIFLEKYIIEKGLPNLYLILEEKNNYNHTAIEINEQRYITPYDIYDTLSEMSSLNDKCKGKYGQSLFKEISEKRKCSDYLEFNESMTFCRCIDN